MLQVLDLQRLIHVSGGKFRNFFKFVNFANTLLKNRKFAVTVLAFCGSGGERSDVTIGGTVVNGEKFPDASFQ
jgi:hypothetical protein